MHRIHIKTPCICTEPSCNLQTTVQQTPSCEGAILTATTTGGGGNYTYVWNGGVVGNPFITTQAGVFVVTVDNQNGCTSTAQITVNPDLIYPEITLQILNVTHTTL